MKIKSLIFCSIILILVGFINLNAQQAFTAGDIAIIGFNYDNPDEFAFVVLVEVEATSQINFTDNGVMSDGSFRTGEGIVIWTAPSSGPLAAGTVVGISNDGAWAATVGTAEPPASGPAFSGSGDQIIAYQGSESNPTFIYALNSEGTGWQADATNSNTSALPPGLVDGTSAVALDEIDNAVYNETLTTGSRTALLSAISNKDNWNGDNSTRQTMPTGPYTVTAGGDDPPSINNIQRNPRIPDEDEDTEITATITDDNGLTLTEIIYRINNGPTQQASMATPGGDTYSGSILASEYGNGDLVEYWIHAQDNNPTAPQSTYSTHFEFLAGNTPISDIHDTDDDGSLLFDGAEVRAIGTATVAANTFSANDLDVYMQDATAGINIYQSGGGATPFVLSNSYTVFGTIDQYNGKAEIIPENSSTDIVDNGPATPVSPEQITIADLLADAESLEGSLVLIIDVTKVSGDWPAEGTSTNLTITDDGGISELTLRIDSDTDIDGSIEGTYPLDVIGIFNQYDTSSPYFDGYQILPRSVADLEWSPSSLESVAYSKIIKEFKLYTNFPNPFNPSTTLQFDVPKFTDNLDLSVYNVAGQKIATLYEGNINQGRFEYIWNGTNAFSQKVPSGIYFAVLKTAEYSQSIKMMLIK